MGVGTNAARIGGLAVALGIGAAVVAGHGVAWADPWGELRVRVVIDEFNLDGFVHVDRPPQRSVVDVNTPPPPCLVEDTGGLVDRIGADTARR